MTRWKLTCAGVEILATGTKARIDRIALRLARPGQDVQVEQLASERRAKAPKRAKRKTATKRKRVAKRRAARHVTKKATRRPRVRRKTARTRRRKGRRRS